MTGHRIVCAACMHNGTIIAGVRHWDMTMRLNAIQMGYNDCSSWKQGFLDNLGFFKTREEAFVIASAAGQILPDRGNPGNGELFSEDLY